MAIDETIFDTATEDMLEHLGQVAIYTPVTGDQIPDVLVFLEHESLIKPDGYDSGVWIQEKTVECRLADIGGAEPDRGATFLIDSVTYTVESIVENDNRFVKCIVK